MNHVTTQASAPNPREDDGTYVLSTHAVQAMTERGISLSRLRDAMSQGTSRAAREPGREVIRDGNLRIVVQRDGQAIRVLTAMFVDDLEP